MSATVALLFLAANFACAAEQMFEGHHEDGTPASHHTGDADSHHDDSGKSDCCASLKSVVPATQTTVHLLQPGLSLQVVVAILSTDAVAVAPRAGLTYDHGPPGASPPEFLLVSSLSPRSPPALA